MVSREPDSAHVTTILIHSCCFFTSRRRYTRCGRDWSSDVCSSDLPSEEVHGSVMDSSSLEARNLINAPAAAAANAAPETPDLGTKAAVREQVVGRRASADRTWQKRLLPVMVGLLVTLTAFFFVASFVQLYYLQTRIERAPRLDLSSAMASLDEIAKDVREGK